MASPNQKPKDEKAAPVLAGTDRCPLCSWPMIMIGLHFSGRSGQEFVTLGCEKCGAEIVEISTPGIAA